MPRAASNVGFRRRTTPDTLLNYTSGSAVTITVTLLRLFCFPQSSLFQIWKSIDALILLENEKYRLSVQIYRCVAKVTRSQRAWLSLEYAYPATWYGINYAGTQITQWDFQNKRTRTSPAQLSFVLKVTLRYLRLSIIYFVPDHAKARAY